MAKYKFVCNPIRTALWEQEADVQDENAASCDLNDLSPGWQGISTDNGVGYAQMLSGTRYCLQYYIDDPESAGVYGAIKIYAPDGSYKDSVGIQVGDDGKGGGFYCFRA